MWVKRGKKGEGGDRRRRGQIKSKGDFQGIYGLETPVSTQTFMQTPPTTQLN